LGYDSGTTQDASKEALIEPIPLNSEQRDAVQRALSQPLTVITGPPGTGKSQVVTSIIINAAMRGTTVLFSSKNNKAVDVVETRVNSLGQRPILLRLGTRDFQGRLSDYLTKLVSLKTEPEDEQVYESAKREYSELSSELTTKKRKIDEAIIFRNKVDDLENQLEQARSHLGEDLSRYQHQVDLDAMHSALNQLLVSIKRSDPKGQGWLAKLFPKVGKRSRQSALTESGVKVVSAFEKFSLTLPEISGPFEAWEDFVTDATVIEHSLAEIPAYFEQLRSLSSKEDMGQLARASVDLQERIADKSMTLWQAWLKTIPARLTPADRRSLTQFQSSVSMLAQVADSKSAVSLKQEQQRLFPYVSKFLPCWAVTSLSIRNRVPLTKSFFDLVVIDEASQCDIASALPLLIRAKRVVIIGDPLQLRHVSNLDISTDRMLLDQNNLMDSLEWAYSARSLFDLAVAASDSDSMVTLRDHHRSDN
jgi:RecA/RadA recombinase